MTEKDIDAEDILALMRDEEWMTVQEIADSLPYAVFDAGLKDSPEVVKKAAPTPNMNDGNNVHRGYVIVAEQRLNAMVQQGRVATKVDALGITVFRDNSQPWSDPPVDEDHLYDAQRETAEDLLEDEGRDAAIQLYLALGDVLGVEEE